VISGEDGGVTESGADSVMAGVTGKWSWRSNGNRDWQPLVLGRGGNRNGRVAVLVA